MQKVGVYDNLSDVLEVIDVDTGELTNMTADELKEQLKRTIDA